MPLKNSTKEEILNKLRGHEFRVDEAPARQTPAAYGYDPRVGNPVGKRWEDLLVILTRKKMQFHREPLWTMIIRELWKKVS